MEYRKIGRDVSVNSRVTSVFSTIMYCVFFLRWLPLLNKMWISGTFSLSLAPACVADWSTLKKQPWGIGKPSGSLDHSSSMSSPQ